MARNRPLQSTLLFPTLRAITTFSFEKASLGEKEMRLAMLDTFFTTFTERLEVLQAIHDRIMACDPHFYGSLASWYIAEGESGTHREIFLAHLLTSREKAHREAAAIIIQSLSPAEISKAMDYCKRVIRRFPRSAKNAIIHYLRALETNPSLFDTEVLKGRKYLKHLYSSLRIRPDHRAQLIIFRNEPPENSLLGALKRLMREEEPDIQSQIIFENKIPFAIAINSMKNLTAGLAGTLVSSMSSEELKSCLNVLKNRGVLKNAWIKELIDEKLQYEKNGSPGAPPVKPGALWKAFEITDTIEDTVMSIAGDCIKRKEEIVKPTALLIDKSGSMEIVLNVGKIVATLCSSIADNSFYVYLFDSVAFPVVGAPRTFNEWDQAFGFLMVGGSSSLGTPVESMREKRELVEQIVIVTDGNENCPPSFLSSFQHYREEMLISPRVIIVKVGHFNEKFSRSLFLQKIPCDFYEFNEDTLPELLSYLILPSYSQLLDEIMATPLPGKKT